MQKRTTWPVVKVKCPRGKVVSNAKPTTGAPVLPQDKFCSMEVMESQKAGKGRFGW